MNFRSDMKEILISEVQSRPALWQDNNKNFKNKNVTNKLWIEVGNACGVDGSIAKTKWKNLKDQYRRELQKLSAQKLRSKAKPTIIKWQHFNRLQFLRDIVTSGTPHRNLDVGNSRCNDIIEENDDDDIEYDDDDDDDEEIIDDDTIQSAHEHFENVFEEETVSSRRQSRASTSRVIERTSTRKRKTGDFNEGCLKLQKKKVSPLDQELSETNMNTPECADLQFFKSLLPYMERLPLLDKLEVRNNIQQMVLEKLKMNELQMELNFKKQLLQDVQTQT